MNGSGVQQTEKEARQYAATMEQIHRQPPGSWLPFKIPAGTRAREWGRYGCCKASERADYEAGGAVFLDPKPEAANAS